MAVEITVPDDFAGSIMGDLNSRADASRAWTTKGGNTIVKPKYPWPRC